MSSLLLEGLPRSVPTVVVAPKIEQSPVNSHTPSLLSPSSSSSFSAPPSPSTSPLAENKGKEKSEVYDDLASLENLLSDIDEFELASPPLVCIDSLSTSNSPQQSGKVKSPYVQLNMVKSNDATNNSILTLSDTTNNNSNNILTIPDMDNKSNTNPNSSSKPAINTNINNKEKQAISTTKIDNNHSNSKPTSTDTKGTVNKKSSANSTYFSFDSLKKSNFMSKSSNDNHNNKNTQSVHGTDVRAVVSSPAVLSNFWNKTVNTLKTAGDKNTVKFSDMKRAEEEEREEVEVLHLEPPPVNGKKDLAYVSQNT